MGRIDPCSGDRLLERAMEDERLLQRDGKVSYKSARDSQRSKLYLAEDTAVKMLNQDGVKTVFRNFNSINKFIEKVRRSDFVNKFDDDSRYQEVYLKRKAATVNRASCVGYSDFSILNIPDSAWGRSKFVILHELAHHFTKPYLAKEGGHGAAFALKFLDLVGEFVSAEASRRIDYSFQHHGVNMIPKSLD